ncbi:MAG: hypothetical protein AAF478_10270 [Pseudomonadota bacterium]
MIRRPFIWFTKDEQAVRDFIVVLCTVLGIASAIWPYIWMEITDLNTGGVNSYNPELNINAGAAVAWGFLMFNVFSGWMNAAFLTRNDHDAVYVFRLDIRYRYPLLIAAIIAVVAGGYFERYSLFTEWVMSDEYGVTTTNVLQIAIGLALIGLFGWFLFPTILQEWAVYLLAVWFYVTTIPLLLFTLYQFDEYGWSALRWALVVWFLILFWGFGMTNLWSLIGSVFALLLSWIFFNRSAPVEYANDFEDWTTDPSSPPPKQKTERQNPKPPEEKLLLDYFKPRSRKEAAIWRLLNDPSATEGEKQAAMTALNRLREKQK